MAAKEFLNQSQIAQRYGVDRATARQRLEDAGIEPTPGRHREKLYEITPALEAAMLPESVADYEAERARKTRYDADLRELELAQRRGELIDRREVLSDMQAIFTKLYQKLVNQQPRELGGALYRAESPEHCTAILQKATAQVFNDLRDEHEKYLDAGSDK